MRNHQEDKDENEIKRNILPSVLAIAICVICLISTSWAWFSSSITNEGTKMQASNYGVTITVDGAEFITDVLTTGTHTVVIKAGGTATSGYAVINLGNTAYHTAKIKPTESITITVITAADTKFSVIGSWGDPGVTNLIVNGSKLGENTPAMAAAPTTKIAADGSAVVTTKAAATQKMTEPVSTSATTTRKVVTTTQKATTTQKPTTKAPTTTKAPVTTKAPTTTQKPVTTTAPTTTVPTTQAESHSSALP